MELTVFFSRFKQAKWEEDGQLLTELFRSTVNSIGIKTMVRVDGRALPLLYPPPSSPAPPPQHLKANLRPFVKPLSKLPSPPPLSISLTSAPRLLLLPSWHCSRTGGAGIQSRKLEGALSLKPNLPQSSLPATLPFASTATLLFRGNLSVRPSSLRASPFFFRAPGGPPF